jgi:hypothetical protein
VEVQAPQFDLTAPVREPRSIHSGWDIGDLVLYPAPSLSLSVALFVSLYAASSLP